MTALHCLVLSGQCRKLDNVDRTHLVLLNVVLQKNTTFNHFPVSFTRGAQRRGPPSLRIRCPEPGSNPDPEDDHHHRLRLHLLLDALLLHQHAVRQSYHSDLLHIKAGHRPIDRYLLLVKGLGTMLISYLFMLYSLLLNFNIQMVD